MRVQAVWKIRDFFRFFLSKKYGIFNEKVLILSLIVLYLNHERRKIMEKEKAIKFTLLLPESMKKASQEEAEKMGLSTTAWIRLAIMDKLKDKK